MDVVHLDAGDLCADTPSGVNEAGWYVEVDPRASYSGPFPTREAAEEAAEKIARGEVDDLPLIEMGELRFDP